MNGKNHEIATLGGGCFWCLEGVFEQLRGIVSVIPGYCGGVLEAPTYRLVCSGKTGHAEVVQLVFDRGCVKTQFNVHLLRSSTRVLRVVDQIEAVSSLRSNLKALNARKRGQFDA